MLGCAGISLSQDQWKKLYSFSDAIVEAIQLVEEGQIGVDSFAGIPGCILRPDGDARAIALPVSSSTSTEISYILIANEMISYTWV